MRQLRRSGLLSAAILCGLLLHGCGGYEVAALREGDYGGGAYGGYGGLAAKAYAAPSKGAAPAAEAEPQGLPEAEAPDIDPARTERLVVYNGVINVVVQRISDSLDRIRSAIAKMGGYMQQMTSDSITLKVPANKFQEAIAEVEKLGEVTQKDIKGTDVTDEMRDLDIRLRNAEQFHERLLKLLERAEKVEDTLKIEKELERITETIELLKGKIAHLKNSVAFCTLTVKFNSPIPQKDVTAITPFEWVHDLGSGLAQPDVDYSYGSRSVWRSSIFELPSGYVKYYADAYKTQAISADGVMIDLHKEENYKGGTIEFWGKLVRRVLVEEKVIPIEEKAELKLNNKSDAVLLGGTKRIGSKEYGYLVALAASKKYVYVFEAWGPKVQFDQDRDKIENTIKSMRPR